MPRDPNDVSLSAEQRIQRRISEAADLREPAFLRAGSGPAGAEGPAGKDGVDGAAGPAGPEGAAGTIRENLAPTPNPDTGLGTWSGANGFWNNASTLTRDTTTAPLGLPASLKVVTSGANPSEGIKSAGPTVGADQKLIISGYLRGAVGGEKVRIGCGDGTVGAAQTPFEALTTEWKRYSFNFTPKASGLTSLAVAGEAEKKAQTFYAGAFVVEDATTGEVLGAVRPYFPKPNQLTTEAAKWVGTAYSSVSILAAVSPRYTQQLVLELFGPEPRAANALQGDLSIVTYTAPGDAFSASTHILEPTMTGEVVRAYWDVAWNPQGAENCGIQLIQFKEGPSEIKELAQLTGKTASTPIHESKILTTEIAALWKEAQTLNSARFLGHRIKASASPAKVPIIFMSRLVILVRF